jgi:hypothetical protein
MPFKTEIISKASEHEPVGRTLGEGAKKIKELKPGESALGVIGEEQPEPEIPEAKPLSPQKLAKMNKIKAILKAAIVPNKLSKRSVPQQDRDSLWNKLDHMSLEELQWFIPEGTDLKTVDLANLDPQLTYEINKLYCDRSP